MNTEPLTRRQLLRHSLTGLSLALGPTDVLLAGQDKKPNHPPIDLPAEGSHQRWLQNLARSLHAGRKPPATLEQWKKQREELRRNLRRSFGQFPDSPCGLNPKCIGVVQRDGYHIERLLIQSRPDVWITANAYVPAKRAGKVPAVLAVHGHWPWAKIDPHVQARCIGLVKLGYFVLVVDAFGAGERAVDPHAKTYHGSLFGAGLWPAGVPLLGLQVYDNMRAADYLQSRPEIDPDRLAITGASGGGNQTMYAGALDERFKAVVPVCSVGTFQSYLTGANCVCETLIAGLTYCEEGDILALVAPRALMVINATRDSLCFSVQEAAKSVAAAEPVFRLYGCQQKLRHLPVESKHDYNQPMREALYGWFDRWLRDRGDGSPVPEPPLETEELNTIRCFPDKQRPAPFHLLPSFMHEQAQARLAKLPQPATKAQWQATAQQQRDKLRDTILGGFPSPAPLAEKRVPIEPLDNRKREQFVIDSEPGMRIPGWWMPTHSPDGAAPIVVGIHPDGSSATMDQPAAKTLLQKPCHLVTVDLRGTGRTASPIDALGDCPDHNSARWSIWLGRPLLAQWVWDILRTVDFAMHAAHNDSTRPVSLLGFREAGLAAILAAAFDSRITRVAAVQTLASYVTDRPFAGHRMAALVPNILSVGDVPHLAALVAPRHLAIAAPLDAQASPLPQNRIEKTFQPTHRIYKLFDCPENLTLTANADPALLSNALLK